MVTKLVKGVASRYPPLEGIKSLSIGLTRFHAQLRIHRKGDHQPGGA